jgi:hypothetical protein
MNIDPDRIRIVAWRKRAQVEPDGVKRIVESAMIFGIFQDTVNQANHAAFAADICGRAWIIPMGHFPSDDNCVTDSKFTIPCAHSSCQSGRTLGISGIAPAFRASLKWEASFANPAPIKLSMVTSLASSSTDMPSVPAGRFGKTK